VQTLKWQRFLNIYHSNGKLTIQATSLPSKSAFEELCSALAERIPAAHHLTMGRLALKHPVLNHIR
jgi:hypothetical protein